MFHIVLPCTLPSCFFSPFSIVITSLGEGRELVYVLLVHLFIYFACADFFLFSLPLGVGVVCGLCLLHSMDFSINFSSLFILGSGWGIS